MIFSTEYLGLGLPIIERSIGGEMNMWYTFLLKIIFTAITLSFYGSGGIVTPILLSAPPAEHYSRIYSA